MKTSFFSVVIPLYNKELSIISTIESVLKQTFEDFEIVVVNDGSTDNSASRVKSIENSKIRLINKPNGGVSSARNRGIMEAKSKYIALLDGDDIWFPNHLQVIYDMIKSMTDAQVFSTRYIVTGREMFDTSGSFYVSNYYLCNIKEVITTGYALMCSSNVVAKRECFITAGMFDERYNYGEDLDMWGRLCEKYILAKSKVCTAQYCITAENRALDKVSGSNKAKRFIFNRKNSQTYSGKLYYGFTLFYNFVGNRILKKEIFNNLDIVIIAGVMASYWRVKSKLTGVK